MRAFGRRLAHFLIVWSALLLIHEAGHAYVGYRQGLEISRVTVGLGPVVWRGETHGTEVVMRLVPLAGLTTLADPHDAHGVQTGAERNASDAWKRHAATLAGGVLATLLFGVAVAGLVVLLEYGTGSRSVWLRMIVADAVVLTIFNLMPVPPLDGGRAVIGAISMARGAPLSEDALFWVQVGGLALAIVPMTLWTRWTARIDAVAMRWRAPVRTRPRSLAETPAASAVPLSIPEPS